MEGGFRRTAKQLGNWSRGEKFVSLWLIYIHGVAIPETHRLFVLLRFMLYVCTGLTILPTKPVEASNKWPMQVVGAVRRGWQLPKCSQKKLNSSLLASWAGQKALIGSHLSVQLPAALRGQMSTVSHWEGTNPHFDTSKPSDASGAYGPIRNLLFLRNCFFEDEGFRSSNAQKRSLCLGSGGGGLRWQESALHSQHSQAKTSWRHVVCLLFLLISIVLFCFERCWIWHMCGVGRGKCNNDLSSC